MVGRVGPIGSAGRYGLLIPLVAGEFPFPGYMEPRRRAYQSIAVNCLRFLAPGARILDFGAGPCDSTAVLTRMGISLYRNRRFERRLAPPRIKSGKIQTFAEGAGST